MTQPPEPAQEGQLAEYRAAEELLDKLVPDTKHLPLYGRISAALSREAQVSGGQERSAWEAEAAWERFLARYKDDQTIGLLDSFKPELLAWLETELAAQPDLASLQPLTVQQVEDSHKIIERHSTDVVDYDGATDDINAYLFGGIEQPESKAAASLQLRVKELVAKWRADEQKCNGGLKQCDELSRLEGYYEGRSDAADELEAALKTTK